MTDRHVFTKTLNVVTATAANALSGSIIQVVSTQTGVPATGTTIMPFDDTIPQNTEGDEYFTRAITPNNASNKLLIVVTAVLAVSVADRATGAIFQDTTASALAAASDFYPNAGAPYVMTFSHYMTAGTTSATTFKFRAGFAVAGTTTLNGQVGGRYMGGVMASSMTIYEIKA